MQSVQSDVTKWSWCRSVEQNYFGAYNCDGVCAEPDQDSIIQLACYSSNVLSIQVWKADHLASAALSSIAHSGRLLRKLSIQTIDPKMMLGNEAVWIHNILIQCPALRTLELSSQCFSRQFLQHLGEQGRNLTDLRLDEAYWDPAWEADRTTDDSFTRLLSNLKRLETLRLTSFTKLSADGLLAIKDLKNLKALALLGVPAVRDDFIQKLFEVATSAPSLNAVDLFNTQITHLSFVSIHKRNGITDLRLAGCRQIDADKFSILTRNVSLRHLDLSSTLADDKLLHNPPPNLHTLVITSCPVTAAAVQSYRETHPEVRVDSEHPPKARTGGWFSWRSK